MMDDKLFSELLASTKEAKEIRSKFDLTQDEFANLLNISVATLRNWEQGRRKPEGPARVLLNIANSYPQILINL